jgi:hypothetical protein
MTITPIRLPIVPAVTSPPNHTNGGAELRQTIDITAAKAIAEKVQALTMVK